MRINGFEQIKSFYSWVFNNPDKVRPTHISLYLFLWNQGNRANWVDWFKCPYDLAMQGACIGNKGTYYRCLDDLQKFNLIKYKKGLNNYKAPQIHLIKLYDSEHLTEQVTVPLSEHLTEPLSVLLSGNIYKLLTNNHKLINSNLEKWILEAKKDETNNNTEVYTEKEFLEDWKKVRLHFHKAPTNIKKLGTFESRCFNLAIKDFSKEDIRNAMQCLFKQEVQDIKSMFLQPKHFLENVEKYHNAHISKEYKLYGSKKVKYEL